MVNIEVKTGSKDLQYFAGLSLSFNVELADYPKPETLSSLNRIMKIRLENVRNKLKLPGSPN